MRRGLATLVGLALAIPAVAGATHPPLWIEQVLPAGDRYVVVGATDPFTSSHIWVAWAAGCSDPYYGECPMPPPAGGNHVQVWRETNGAPGLQREATCDDGTLASSGTCGDGSTPRPADMHEATLR